MAMRTGDDLVQLQAQLLEKKIVMTKQRVREWVEHYGEDGCYVSFSGGKDSTVLLDIVRKMGYERVPAVFADVPTQYPELKTFAKKDNNLVILRPKMSFYKVCDVYGFPLINKEVSESVNGARLYVRGGGSYKYFFEKVMGIGRYDHGGDREQFSSKRYKFLMDAPFEVSHMCCKINKKEPFHEYEAETGRKGMIASLAEESRLRKQKWLQNGCNAFEGKRQISNPMAFWTENDVLEYIFTTGIEICSVYGDVVKDDGGQISLFDLLGMENTCKYKTTGCERTGCCLCGFSSHREKNKEGRFVRLKRTHPKMYALLDIMQNSGVTFRKAIEWVNEHGGLKIQL